MRWALMVLIACGGRAPPPLAASPVMALATVRADQVVTQGDVTYALGAQLAIARGETVTTLVPVDCGAPCPAKIWTSAAAIPALDGDGHWIVATRFDGTLWRIRLDGELEAIAARFGVREPVRAIAGAGTTVAVLLEHAVLVTGDGHHLTRYELDAPKTTLAVAQDRLALGDAHAIDVWDLAANRRRSFAVDGARVGFLDPDAKTSRLVAITPHAVWLERDGELHALDAGPVAAVAIAGGRLWLEVGKRLFIARDATLLDTTIASAGDEPLFGAPNGDVWVGGAPLRRYALGAAGGDPIWRAQVQPIFVKVCAHCHLPGGDADIDLSTAPAWTAEHDELVRRVITTRTMPPAGTTLDPADRATLARFLGVAP
jgi:cbb3-type cytochrome c oxidase subunit III